VKFDSNYVLVFFWISFVAGFFYGYQNSQWNMLLNRIGDGTLYASVFGIFTLVTGVFVDYKFN